MRWWGEATLLSPVYLVSCSILATGVWPLRRSDVQAEEFGVAEATLRLDGVSPLPALVREATLLSPV
ncbi:MAG: hypothetical protein M3Y80_02715 [Verrucomicrobiota bacterium]|nr:hypothetical protein [Verrucomicrobiota bacterium]